MRITRVFTHDFENPYEGINFVERFSSSGRRIIAPDFWSDQAVEIMVQKYSRCIDIDGNQYEEDLRAIFHRLANCWKKWGVEEGYFSDSEGQVFYDEILYMLVHQMASPNSPQWFNTGIYEAYGLEDTAEDFYYVDSSSGRVRKTNHKYKRPTPHACFIQKVDDHLVGKDGLIDLWQKEAKLFKYGAGSGTNFSKIRSKGESLRGGGTSSGLMSFLRVGDANAGSIKSGGMTRRAAKMVCLDIDHPEILDFIDWKVHEEHKALALYLGNKVLNKNQVKNVLSQNEASYKKIQDLYKQYNSSKDFNFIHKDLSLDWESDLYESLGGQNSNNSVRIPDSFIEALKANKDWPLTARVHPAKVTQSLPAQKIWDKLCWAAWSCADPGVQFTSTINSWNTCSNDGEINASNPCSEYMFLDDTACNLASLNLSKFWDNEKYKFKLKEYEHAISIWIIVLDVSVSMARYPSKEVAKNSYNYRTLGLGFSNLGGLIMQMGLPYDSNEARFFAAALTCILTGKSYEVSTSLASKLGPFKRYKKNKKSMVNVLERHQKYAQKIEREVLEMGFTFFKQSERWYQKKYEENLKTLINKGTFYWDLVLKNLTEKAFGVRNAQVTSIAPTGTISFVMDCETMGVEPDYSILKTKKLIGGGEFQSKVNRNFLQALTLMEYTLEEKNEIIQYLESHNPLQTGPIPHLKKNDLKVFEMAHGMFQLSALSSDGHLEMMAAIQPFVSGAISKTINLPQSTSVESISEIYLKAWELGLKSVAIYRDGSKTSQPLSISDCSICS